MRCVCVGADVMLIGTAGTQSLKALSSPALFEKKKNTLLSFHHLNSMQNNCHYSLLHPPGKTVWHLSGVQTFQSMEKGFWNLWDRLRKKSIGSFIFRWRSLMGGLRYSVEVFERKTKRGPGEVVAMMMPLSRGGKKQAKSAGVAGFKWFSFFFYRLFITSCLFIPADSFFFRSCCSSDSIFSYVLVWFNVNLSGIDLR